MQANAKKISNIWSFLFFKIAKRFTLKLLRSWLSLKHLRGNDECKNLSQFSFVLRIFHFEKLATNSKKKNTSLCNTAYCHYDHAQKFFSSGQYSYRNDQAATMRLFVDPLHCANSTNHTLLLLPKITKFYLGFNSYVLNILAIKLWMHFYGTSNALN